MHTRVKYKIQNFTIWITNYSDYDLIRVNKKCGKSYNKKSEGNVITDLDSFNNQEFDHFNKN